MCESGRCTASIVILPPVPCPGTFTGIYIFVTPLLSSMALAMYFRGDTREYEKLPREFARSRSNVNDFHIQFEECLR